MILLPHKYWATPQAGDTPTECAASAVRQHQKWRYRKYITKLEGLFEDTTFIQKTLLHKYTYKKQWQRLGIEPTWIKLIVV